MQEEAASALALLRRPGCATVTLALALAWSLIAYVRFGWSPRFWYLAPVLIVLAVITVLDFRTKIIPNIVTIPGIVYALVLAAFVDNLSIEHAVLGSLVGGGTVLLLAVVSRGAVGGGDIKLMAMLGAALGWKEVLALLAFSQVAAAPIALALLISRRAKKRDHFPVGAVISLVGTVMLLARN